MKETTSRRGFLGRSLVIGGGLAAPAIFPGGFLGAQAPSEKILTGHIGLGGMGTGHLNFFRKYAGALCDVDTSHLNRAARIIGRYVPKYRAFRDLLDQKNLDGVLIATPDHWHGVMAVMACEAGKDVYVQKPSSSTIEEGRAMVNAAQRCGRVMQVGSQGRSTRAVESRLEYVARSDALHGLQRRAGSLQLSLGSRVRRRADSRSRGARDVLCALHHERRWPDAFLRRGHRQGP